MPPVSIGRVGFRLLVPPASQDLFVFLDASGRATETRVWGGLAVFGRDELAWIEDVISELRTSADVGVEPDGEVKGKAVAFAVAQAIGRRVRDEDHRIAFWASRHSSLIDETSTGARTELQSFLEVVRADPVRLDRQILDTRFGEMAAYYRELRPVNQHKIVAIVSHFHWLVEQLRLTGTGSRLARAEIVIDREDFPRPLSSVGKLLKVFVCSGLQASGMSYRVTGAAMREAVDEGAVTVNVHGDSRAHAGLQFADILLQVVQRQLLPAKGRRRI